MAKNTNSNGSGEAGTGPKHGTAGTRPGTTKRNDGPKNPPPAKKK